MNYRKKSFVKLTTTPSETNGINFAKIFIESKSKTKGPTCPSTHFSIPSLEYRLQGVKENVADLQQRLQQYQKKNDEMHEKIGALERKVGWEVFFLSEIDRTFV